MLGLLKFGDVVFVLLAAVNVGLSIDSVAQTFATHTLDATTFTSGTIEVGAATRVNSGAWSIGEVGDCEMDDGTYKNPEVRFSCPYASTSAFIGPIAAWMAYFFLILILRAYASMKYEYNDFRFLLYLDAFAAGIVSKILFFLGVAGTVGTCIYAFVYVAKEFQGVDSTIPPGKIWAPIQFAIINIVGINFNPAFSKAGDKFEEVFEKFAAEPIAIKALPTGGDDGIVSVLKTLFNRQDFFSTLQTALADHLSGRDTLKNLTDQPEALVKLLQALTEEPAEPEKSEPA